MKKALGVLLIGVGIVTLVRLPDMGIDFASTVGALIGASIVCFLPAYFLLRNSKVTSNDKSSERDDSDSPPLKVSDYAYFMTKKNDEELTAITTHKRSAWIKEAVEAAELEIKNRKVVSFQSSITINLGGFQNGFTNVQKACIISTLVVITKADGKPHPKKAQDIEETAIVLGIELDDPLFKEIKVKGMNYVIETLKTLDKSQREWYMVSIHGLAKAEGTPSDEEISTILKICNDIGISEDMYTDTIEKTETLRQKLFC